MIKSLGKNETELVGGWIQENGSVVSDGISQRIEYLIQNKLKKVTSSDDGWDQLYLDAESSCYWELSRPESESHGGGAPVLKKLSFTAAKSKYQV